ncbi:(d)CMP kinase [Clostridium perfringens]|nr:(d)CMP kinase [Clostridium perfringens]EJT6566363.1 (d)CMP kinase [Clostridium perfringens]
MNKLITVAIDGPAGAGKSTIAKIIGEKFNLMYINTGSMYRAVTLKALENNISAEEVDKLLVMIDGMDMHFENDELILNGENINSLITMPNISKNVSAYASIREVRERLVNLMRKMALKYSVIMDGRDIGTVVLKDANFKFFLTASPEERADRRYKELMGKGVEVNYDEILQDIIKRDYLDSNREVDPLRKAEDAIEIDTTGIGIMGVVEKISSYMEKYYGKKRNFS